MSSKTEDNAVEDLSYLEKAFSQRDIVFISDHGDQDLLRGLRINIRERISALKIFKFMPNQLILGFALYFVGLFKKNAVFITFGNQKSTYILMLLQKLFNKFIKPNPHILVDCLWEPKNNFFGRNIIKLRAYLVNNVISKCIVYGKKDIDSFHKTLGISYDKLLFLPYHHTLRGLNCDINSINKYIVDGDYIFSGGTDGRDYDSLMKVCDELSLPLKIATLDKEIINKGRNNKLFEIRSMSPKEFRYLMAGSRLVVIPYGKNILRTGGHQTFLNAMLMGKAVIIYNADIAEGYILNGVNGIIIHYGDINSLRLKIYELYHSKEKREKIGKNAKQYMINNKLNQEEWVYRIYNIAARAYYTQQII